MVRIVVIAVLVLAMLVFVSSVVYRVRQEREKLEASRDFIRGGKMTVLVENDNKYED